MTNALMTTNGDGSAIDWQDTHGPEAFQPMHLREADLEHPLRNFAKQKADAWRQHADDLMATAQKNAAEYRKLADDELAEAEKVKNQCYDFADAVEKSAEEKAREVTAALRCIHAVGEACKQAREIFFTDSKQ